MEATGKVTKIRIFKEKGSPGICCETILAVEGKGLEGDRHADGGEKQISILDGEVRRWMEATPEKGLCFHRFKENLQIDGELVPLLSPGDILKIGEAELRITGKNKRCFSECPLFSAGKECRLSRGNAWAEVKSSGVIQIGNETILKKEYREKMG